MNQVGINLGDRVATEVTKSDPIQWLDEAVEEHEFSIASRNRNRAALSLIFCITVGDGKPAKNPAAGIEHLQEDSSRAR